jgi:hypothetical protein
MPLFIVRVELHKSADRAPDYDQLHRSMAEAGFSREVTLADGLYKLPEAEYAIYKDLTAVNIGPWVEKIAAKSAKACTVMVSRGDDLFLSQNARAPMGLGGAAQNALFGLGLINTKSRFS